MSHLRGSRGDKDIYLGRRSSAVATTHALEADRVLHEDAHRRDALPCKTLPHWDCTALEANDASHVSQKAVPSPITLS